MQYIEIIFLLEKLGCVSTKLHVNICLHVKDYMSDNCRLILRFT